MRLAFTRRFALSCVASSALVILALSGCAGAGSSAGSRNATPGNNPTQPPATQPSPTQPTFTTITEYCTLVSLAEMSSITGMTITHLSSLVNPTQQEVLCEYQTNNAGALGIVIAYYVSADAGQSQTLYTTLEQQEHSKGIPLTTVSGMGDQAFSEQKGGVSGVTARKGRVIFTASGSTTNPPSLSTLTQLGQLVASRL